MPCVAEERLTELQRQTVERTYTQARNGLLAYGIGGALLLPGALGFFVWSGGALDRRSWVVLAIAVTAFAALLLVCVAKALDRGRAALPLRRDLEDGFVWVFEGRLAHARYEEEDPEVLALLNAGLLAHGEREQRLCVLPYSGRLMQVNGQDQPDLRRLHVATTAAWPAQRFRFSLPPEMKRVFGPSGRDLKRRRMGQAERAEIEGHITRLTALPWLLIALTALMSTSLSLWLVRPRSLPLDLLALVCSGVWLYAALRHLRGYSLARRLEADLEVGWFLSWEAAEPGPPARDPRDTRPPPFKRAEVLPVSQRDWTIDAKPAAWRRVLSRR